MIDIYSTWEATFQEGTLCEECEFLKVIREPHGETTYHCSAMDDYDSTEDCLGVQRAEYYSNALYDEYKESRAGFYEDT